VSHIPSLKPKQQSAVQSHPIAGPLTVLHILPAIISFKFSVINLVYAD
jgi:hypothetical protein